LSNVTDIDLIPELMTATTSNETGSIIVEKVVKLGSPENLKSTEDYVWSGTVYSGSKKRVNWEKGAKTYPLLGYCKIGGEIKYQEKKALGWFAQKRSLSLSFHCDQFTYGGGCSYVDSDINKSDSETAKSLSVYKRYGRTWACNISGLTIDFNANGITASK
jgi:hypothetical protein